VTGAAASYREFVDAAVEIAGSDASSVQVFDHDRGGLRLAGWRGFHPVSAAFWELVVPESASTCGMALVTGERVVVPNLEAEAALADSEDLHEYRRSRLGAVQSTPLVADDGCVVGMLSTHWRRSHEPSAADLRRIDSLARRCAAAVARERVRPMHNLSAVAVQLHEVNRRIREMAGQFAATAGDDAPQDYLCECGCGGWVALTGDEFDAHGAAQRPLTAPGHLLDRGQAARQLPRAARPK
jgi:GAF domain